MTTSQRELLMLLARIVKSYSGTTAYDHDKINLLLAEINAGSQDIR